MNYKDYEFTIYNDINNEIEFLIRNFEQEIKHLNITSSIDWIKTWWNVFQGREDNKIGFDKQLYIITVKKQGNLIAILPLIKLKRKKFGIKVSYLEFLGQQWCATFLDFISIKLADNENKLIIGWLYQNVKFDILNLSYIPSYTTNFNLDDNNIFVISGCPSIDLSEYDDFQSYQNKTYTKRLKQNFRTAFNKMKKNDLDYNILIEPMNEGKFRQIVKLSMSKLNDGKSCIYLDSGKANFLEELCKRLKHDIVILKINNIDVAYRLNFYWMNNKFCIDASYNRDYKHFELGSLSVHESIKDSFTKDIKIHCEGTGIDFYKLKFTKNIIKIYQFIKPGNTLLGKMVYLKMIFSCKQHEKKFLKELAEHI
jgi:hypothetical protein